MGGMGADQPRLPNHEWGSPYALHLEDDLIPCAHLGHKEGDFASSRRVPGMSQKPLWIDLTFAQTSEGVRAHIGQ
jgi:hypothetical protein